MRQIGKTRAPTYEPFWKKFLFSLSQIGVERAIGSSGRSVPGFVHGDREMKRLTVGLTALAVLLGVGQTSTAAIQTENFDVDPGWTVVGSGVNGNDFGYQAASSYAGGSPGEGGGRFTRSDFVTYYADTDLGGTLTLDQPFSASGKFSHTDADWPDFGWPEIVGHFSPTGYGRIGVGFTDTSTPNLHWRATILTNDFFTSFGSTPVLVTPNVEHTWAYEWDPDGGTSGGGMLAVTLDGDVHTIELTAAERAIGATLTAFGFAGTGAPGGTSKDYQYADMYICLASVGSGKS